MESVFIPVPRQITHNREYFVELWQAVEQQYALYITIHDHTGSLLLSDGRMLRPLGNIHRCDFCTYNRQYHGNQCVDHCRWQIAAEAARSGKPFISRCHAGAVELVLPLLRRGKHLATIFAGTFRDPELKLPAGSPKELVQLYNALPAWRAKNVSLYMRELEMLGAALLALAENERFSSGNALRGRRAVIEDFFRFNLSTPDLGLKNLADKLELSQSRTSHILKMEFNQSFSNLLTQVRIERVCQLLCSTEMTLGKIAQLCGFRNEYYLSRVFRRATGMPPGSYRNAVRQSGTVAREDIENI